MIYTKIRSVESPQRAHSNDSGIDFFIPENLGFITNVVSPSIEEKRFFVNSNGILQYSIYPGESVKIPLGIKVDLPNGCDLTFVNRSSIASKQKLIVGANLIDNPYRGELILNLINVGKEVQFIQEGQKIVQGVIRSVNYISPIEVSSSSELSKTARGEGGFGSSEEKVDKFFSSLDEESISVFKRLSTK